MFERFKKGPKLENQIRSGDPDVKFFGFGSERLPFTVGVDIESYQRLLQEQLKIDPSDISRISLRFIGFTAKEDREVVGKDIEELKKGLKKKPLVRVVTIEDELRQIEKMSGFTLDTINFEDVRDLILHILGAKLVMESISIKREIVHKKLHKNPIHVVDKVLDNPMFYASGFVSGEYLLKDMPWSLRAYILATSFLASKFVELKLNNKINEMHENLGQDLGSQLSESLTDSFGIMLPEIKDEWQKLFTIYPTNGKIQ